jgi:hypothetical protein
VHKTTTSKQERESGGWLPALSPVTANSTVSLFTNIPRPLKSTIFLLYFVGRRCEVRKTATKLLEKYLRSERVEVRKANFSQRRMRKRLGKAQRSRHENARTSPFRKPKDARRNGRHGDTSETQRIGLLETVPHRRLYAEYDVFYQHT